MELIGYLALVGIGIVLSLLGGGGSLLSVPILIYLFSLDIVTASSYSLFIVGTTSLSGSLLKIKQQRTDWRSGIIFSLCSMVAIFSTRKWIIPCIPEEIMLADSHIVTKRALIMGVFALLVMTSSLMILLKDTWCHGDQGKRRLQLLFPLSFITGVVTGFVGAGGGFLILPALIIFGGLSFDVSVGTTLLVIAFNSLFGFLGDVLNHPINWLFLLTITALSTLGMLLGNHYSSKIPAHYLKLIFAWIMLIAAILILLAEVIF
jgi:uncharacterized membrane protein YfcA